VLTFAENDLTATVSRLCGNPIKITFTPPFAVPTAATGIAYTVRFSFEDAFNNHLGSNINTSEVYPSINVGFSPTVTHTANRVIELTEVQSYASTAFTTYMAIENTPGAGNTDLNTYLFYTDSNGDPHVEYVLSQTLNAAIAANAAPGAYTFSGASTARGLNVL